MSAGEARATGIDGAEYTELRVIDTPGGAVMHMLRKGSPLLPDGGRGGDSISVGEVYFSETLPGAVKAWKRHTRQTQYFAVPVGRLGLVLYDDREGSPTRGTLKTFILGRNDLYALLKIPCGVWYGFTAVGDTPAVICNAADIPHDPTEGVKLPPESPEGKAIPFDWSRPFPG